MKKAPNIMVKVFATALSAVLIITSSNIPWNISTVYAEDELNIDWNICDEQASDESLDMEENSGNKEDISADNEDSGNDAPDVAGNSKDAEIGEENSAEMNSNEDQSDLSEDGEAVVSKKENAEEENSDDALIDEDTEDLSEETDADTEESSEETDVDAEDLSEETDADTEALQEDTAEDLSDEITFSDEITGENSFTWNIDKNGELTINAFGDIPYVKGSTPWYERSSEIKKAVVSIKGASDLHYLFKDCTALKSVDFTDSDTSTVTNVSGMFYNCRALTDPGLEGLNTFKVTDMNTMFFNCFALTELDLTNLNTAKATNMDAMFSGCCNLEVLDMRNFDMRNAGNTSSFIDGCSQLKVLRAPRGNRNPINLPSAGKWYYSDDVITETKATPSNMGSGMVFVREDSVLYERGIETGTIAYPEGLWIRFKNTDTFVYQNRPITPAFEVYNCLDLLEEGKDYKYSFSNNINANDKSNHETAPSLTVTGCGGYKGKDKAYFTIMPEDINNCDFETENVLVMKGQKSQSPKPVLTLNGEAVSAKCFTCTYIDENGKELSKVKKEGVYTLRVTGRKNLMSHRDITLTVTSRIDISKASVSKIATQKYTGKAIEPEFTVKYGRKTLTKGADYAITYKQNVEIGTAKVIVTALNPAYFGKKEFTFKIKGTEIGTLDFYGIPKSVVYTGLEQTIENSGDFNAFRIVNPKTGDYLVEGEDFTVEYKKNINKGKASMIFTGKGAYSGKIKKTFTIVPCSISSGTYNGLNINCPDTVPYAKGGAKPAITISGKNIPNLTSSVDYTIKCKNNTEVGGVGTVTITGKGNYTGSTILTYKITSKDMSQVKLSAPDVKFAKKGGNYQTAFTIKDTNSKALELGKDYDKNIEYFYTEDTVINDGTVQRQAGDKAEKKDIVPAGTVMKIVITGKDKYVNTASATYRVTAGSIASAKITIKPQVYTGKEIKLSKDDISVKINGNSLVSGANYRIVSYSNNVNTGKAKVTIEGVGDYGGRRTVSFIIRQKTFKWWKF